MESDLTPQRAIEISLGIAVSCSEEATLEAAGVFFCSPRQSCFEEPPEEWEEVECALIERLISRHRIPRDRAKGMLVLALIGGDDDEIRACRDDSIWPPPAVNHGTSDGG